MKFDELIEFLAENNVPEIQREMARPVNPEFQKWKQENPGVPTYKFFKMQRDRKAAQQAPQLAPTAASPEDAVRAVAGAEEPPIGDPIHLPPSPVGVIPNVVGGAPESPHFKELPDSLRTREAIDEFLQANPGASDEEIIDHLNSQHSEETPLNLDPEYVKSAIEASKSETAASTADISDPSPEDITKSAKSDLAAKYDRMRKALYKARGFKVPDEDIDVDLEDDDKEDEEFPVDMSDEPIDPVER